MTKNEILFDVLNHESYDISTIPREYLEDPMIAHALVNHRFVNWVYIPSSLSNSPQFVLMQVKNDPRHFRWINSSMREIEEICYHTLVNLKKCSDFLLEFQLVPKHILTETFVKKVILENPTILPLYSHMEEPFQLTPSFVEAWFNKIEVEMKLEGDDIESKLFDLVNKSPILVAWLPNEYRGLSKRIAGSIIKSGYGDKILDMLAEKYPNLERTVWVSLKVKQEKRYQPMVVYEKRGSSKWIELM